MGSEMCIRDRAYPVLLHILVTSVFPIAPSFARTAQLVDESLVVLLRWAIDYHPDLIDHRTR